MACLPLDVICMLGEVLAPALAVLWIFIQAMAFIFGAAIVFKLSRYIYKGRYIEANLIIALWSGYVAYTIAGWFALAGAIAAIVVLLLAIFTPLGGAIGVWLLGKVGGGK